MQNHTGNIYSGEKLVKIREHGDASIDATLGRGDKESPILHTFMLVHHEVVHPYAFKRLHFSHLPLKNIDARWHVVRNTHAGVHGTAREQSVRIILKYLRCSRSPAYTDDLEYAQFRVMAHWMCMQHSIRYCTAAAGAKSMTRA